MWSPLPRPLFAIAPAVVILLCGAAVAAERFEYGDISELPEKSPGPPRYVVFIPDDDWTAIVFQRDITCMPLDANLLLLPDFDALFCPLVVEGFAITDDGPLSPPLQSVLQGQNTDVWFVPTADFFAIAADGEVTLLELVDLETLEMGIADSYVEVLHAEFGGAQVPSGRGVGYGSLDDGRRFFIQAVQLFTPPDGESEIVRIEVDIEE